MTNQLITYEHALALKELGFDEKCFAYKIKGQKESIKVGITNTKLDKEADKYRKTYKGLLSLRVALPLYQQAFNFLQLRLEKDYTETIALCVWSDGSGHCKFSGQPLGFLSFDSLEEGLGKLIKRVKKEK